jgi:hypothetical protein
MQKPEWHEQWHCIPKHLVLSHNDNIHRLQFYWTIWKKAQKDRNMKEEKRSVAVGLISLICNNLSTIERCPFDEAQCNNVKPFWNEP